MPDHSIIAPRIETERLILREFRRGDFDTFAKMCADPLVARFTGGVITDRSVAWEKFCRAPGFWSLLGYGLWIVEEKESGRYAGNLGFGNFERAIDPPLPDIPEGAWVLDRWAHGKGYAFEAMMAVLDWCDTVIGSGQCCIIAEENTASLKLADRLGFQEVRRVDFKGDPTIIFERTTA